MVHVGNSLSHDYRHKYNYLFDKHISRANSLVGLIKRVIPLPG